MTKIKEYMPIPLRDVKDKGQLKRSKESDIEYTLQSKQGNEGIITSNVSGKTFRLRLNTIVRVKCS